MSPRTPCAALSRPSFSLPLVMSLAGFCAPIARAGTFDPLSFLPDKQVPAGRDKTEFTIFNPFCPVQSFPTLAVRHFPMTRRLPLRLRPRSNTPPWTPPPLSPKSYLAKYPTDYPPPLTRLRSIWSCADHAYEAGAPAFVFRRQALVL